MLEKLHQSSEKMAKEVGGGFVVNSVKHCLGVNRELYEVVAENIKLSTFKDDSRIKRTIYLKVIGFCNYEKPALAFEI
jgi:hypothetical protein